MPTAIKVENLSKAYQLGEIGTGTISQDLERWLARIRGKEDPFLKVGETNDRTVKGTSNMVWSLKDINFDINQGDAVGIIGKNGAGKSTLLKILSRVTSPTTGSARLKGRVASLLEVGTGFHPELTGRENVFLNGAILGMRKAEISRKFDEIVAFSGVERYIDTPVKRYSSGMYVRLAFAVAAHLEAEILVVDEVLAVGDAEFQKKCLGKMGDVSKGEGRTIIFVSHNMAAIDYLCNSAVFLRNGMLMDMGATKSVISNYLSYGATGSAINDLTGFTDRQGNGDLRFTTFEMIDPVSGKAISEVPCGSDAIFRFYLDKNVAPLEDVMFAVGINDQYEQRISFLSNQMLNKNIDTVAAGKDHIDLFIEHMPITPGRYNLTLYCTVKGELADWVQNALYFDVASGDYYNTGKEVAPGNGTVLINYSFPGC